MKKNIILIVGIIVIVCGIITFIILINRNSNVIKLKGNMVYGDEICENILNGNKLFFEDDNHSLIGLTVMSDYFCALCGKHYTYGSSPTPVICERCASITNRCRDCGKLLKK